MLMLLLIAMTAPNGAATDTDEKVHISADRVEIIHRKKQVEFTGNVLVKRGGLTLSCERLYGQYDGQELNRLQAEGAVTVQRDNIKATAQKAIYQKDKQTLILTGMPTLTKNGSRLLGQRILIWLSSERVIVEKPKGTFDLKQLEMLKSNSQ